MKYSAVFFLLIFLFLPDTIFAGDRKFEKQDSYSFTKTSGSPQGSVVINLQGNKYAKFIEYIHINKSTYDSPAKTTRVISLTDDEFKEFVNIVNYSRMFGAKKYEINPLGTICNYELKTANRNIETTRYFTTIGEVHSLYFDKAILRVWFVELFLDNIIFCRKNGKLDVWGDKK